MRGNLGLILVMFSPFPGSVAAEAAAETGAAGARASRARMAILVRCARGWRAEFGLLSPPLGIAVYVVHATLARPNVSLRDVFLGAAPFALAMP